LYVAEVWFENFAALDNWEAYFKTEEGKDIGARVINPANKTLNYDIKSLYCEHGKNRYQATL